MRILNILNVCAAVALSVSAMEVKAAEFIMTSEYEYDSLMGKGDKVFVEKVKDLSNGDISIILHLNGSLGLKSADNLDAVADGVVHMADTLGGVLAGSDPIFLLASLPFIVNNGDEARALYDAARPAYEAFFARHGQILLYASPWVSSGFWGKKPIDSQEALTNWKVRTYDASGTRTMVAAGAAPIQLSWADVVPQLATGGIDGVLTSSEGGVTAKFYEHLSHFTEINYALPLNFRHMNADAFNGLSPEHQQLIRDAAAQTEEESWIAARDLVEATYSIMQGHGVTIVREVEPEFRTHLNAAASDVLADWKQRAGEDGTKVMQEYGQKVGREY